MSLRSAIALFAVAVHLFVSVPAFAEEPAAKPTAKATETEEPEKKKSPTFSVTFDAKFVPSEKSAEVEIRLGNDASPVEWMLFRHDPARHQAFHADGELVETEEGWKWTPPPGGGAIRYVFSVDHLRSDGAFDSRSAKRWAIFRGEDLVSGGGYSTFSSDLLPNRGDLTRATLWFFP